MQDGRGRLLEFHPGRLVRMKKVFCRSFMCQPADDNTAFLTYDLIAGCEYKENEPWQTDLLDCKNPLFVGVDIGREHDLTVIWVHRAG